jgi:hypothetical protein
MTSRCFATISHMGEEEQEAPSRRARAIHTAPDIDLKKARGYERSSIIGMRNVRMSIGKLV